ncbi:MAG: antibiotic biosynthesis monooxygenase [Brachybacterium sp.]|uniref:putative quinol monooxygenase n=1 Tax=Brachybacterium sp. TaxID=1891286 RepID=UPI003241DD79
MPVPGHPGGAAERGRLAGRPRRPHASSGCRRRLILLAEADAVRRHLPEHVALTLAEPGCLRVAVEPTEDPLVWSVSELFRDHAAFEAHRERVRSSACFEATSGIARDYVVSPARD